MSERQADANAGRLSPGPVQRLAVRGKRADRDGRRAQTANGLCGSASICNTAKRPSPLFMPTDRLQTGPQKSTVALSSTVRPGVCSVLAASMYWRELSDGGSAALLKARLIAGPMQGQGGRGGAPRHGEHTQQKAEFALLVLPVEAGRQLVRHAAYGKARVQPRISRAPPVAPKVQSGASSVRGLGAHGSGTPGARLMPSSRSQGCCATRTDSPTDVLERCAIPSPGPPAARPALRLDGAFAVVSDGVQAQPHSCCGPKRRPASHADPAGLRS